jgi:exopolysaccharide production protein ExoZ
MQGTERVSSIQSLRALAAVAVLTRHCHDEFYLGSAGVDLFFVISGFIMVYASRDLFGSYASVKNFVRLRLIRIVPPYWIATTILIFVLGAPSIAELTRSYLFVPEGQPFLKPGRSLIFEMFFYALFACVLFLPMRSAVIALSGLLIAIVLVGPNIRNQYVLYLSQPILLEFLFGALAGLAFVEGLRLNRRWSFSVILVAILFFALSTTLREQPTQGWRVVAWGVPAALLFIGTVFGPNIKAVEIRPLIVLGNASYSLYLTHWFFVVTYGVANPLVTFVFSIIFAIGFFMWSNRRPWNS